MNARRKRAYRAKQRQENMPLMKFCKRCKKPFSPEWLDELKKWTNMCERCGVLNIMEACGLIE